MAKTPVSSSTVDDIVAEGDDLAHKLNRQADYCLLYTSPSPRD